MTRAEQLRTINAAFADIPDLFDGYRNVRDLLRDMSEAAERRHRKGTPNGVQNCLSVAVAARLYTVQYLLDGFAKPNLFTVDDITSVRNEVLYSQAYAKRFHNQLAPWAQRWAQLFKQVDYTKLMKGAS